MVSQNVPDIIKKFNFGEKDTSLVKFIEDHATRCTFDNKNYNITLEFNQTELPNKLSKHLTTKHCENTNKLKAELSGDIVIALMHTGLDFQLLMNKTSPSRFIDDVYHAYGAGRQNDSGRKPESR